MSRFKPRSTKYPWRDFLTAVEVQALSECDLLIAARNADLGNARRLRASIVATASKRAQAHAGREGRHG
jgi:hypothetical protein